MSSVVLHRFFFFQGRSDFVLSQRLNRSPCLGAPPRSHEIGEDGRLLSVYDVF